MVEGTRRGQHAAEAYRDQFGEAACVRFTQDLDWLPARARRAARCPARRVALTGRLLAACSQRLGTRNLLFLGFAHTQLLCRLALSALAATNVSGLQIPCLELLGCRAKRPELVDGRASG
jgi:hypothetical protein